jgi:hypothetical protein
MTGGVDSHVIILNDRNGDKWAIYPYDHCPPSRNYTTNDGPDSRVSTPPAVLIPA